MDSKKSQTSPTSMSTMRTPVTEKPAYFMEPELATPEKPACKKAGFTGYRIGVL